MNIELGKYATEVLLSYAGTLVLLVGIVMLSLSQSRKMAKALERAEAAQAKGQNADG